MHLGLFLVPCMPLTNNPLRSLPSSGQPVSVSVLFWPKPLCFGFDHGGPKPFSMTVDLFKVPKCVTPGHLGEQATQAEGRLFQDKLGTTYVLK